MIRRSDRTVIFLIFVLALIFRMIGIRHGFPFIFHPDEPTIIRSALGIRFFPNPGHFDWPHLYIYINYFIYMGFAYARDFITSIGIKDLVSASFPIIWNDDLIFYLITRKLTAFLGALTVIPIYLTAKNLFGSKAGLLAGFVMAIIPFHVHHSHYSLTDAPMVFFLAWGMYFSSKVLLINDPGMYASSGFYSGLAASTKYNGGLSIISVPLAHLIRIIKSKDEELIDLKGIINLFIAGFLALIGFLIGTPYAIFDFNTFIRTDGPKGALWQFTNVGSVEFVQRFPKFLNDLFYKISDDLGYTLLILFFVSLGYLIYQMIRKRTRDEELNLWFVFLPAVFLLFYISGFEKSRSHYFMIAYPYVSVVVGYALARIFTVVETKVRYLGFLVLFLLLLPPFYMSAVRSFRFYNGDTRQDLNIWLESNVETGSTVIYDDDEIKLVLEEKGLNLVKGTENLESVPAGYLVINPEKITEYGLGGKLEMRNSTLVKSIKDAYRLGPEISVYKFEN